MIIGFNAQNERKDPSCKNINHEILATTFTLAHATRAMEQAEKKTYSSSETIRLLIKSLISAY